MKRLNKCIPLFIVAICLSITPVTLGSSYSGLGLPTSSYSTPATKQSQVAQVANTTFFMVQGSPTSYIWNTGNNTVRTSFGSDGGGAGTGVGLWLDNKRQFYNTSGTYGGIMCYLDSSQTILTLTFPTSLGGTFTTKKVWGIGAGAFLHTCFVDWPRGILWAYGSKSNGQLFRFQLSSNPADSLTPSSSVSYYLRARASAVNRLTDTAYIVCDNAQMIVVPLNTTNLSIKLPVIQVGVSNLITVGIDEAQNYMFIGTDIGIGLKYTIGRWLEVQLFFIVGSIDLLGVYPQTDRNVSYWAGGDGALYRVNYDGFNFNVVYDSANISTKPSVGGFLLSNDSSIGYFVNGDSSYNVIKTKLFDCTVHPSCESCSLDPYNCGWCGTIAKCTLRGNCTSGPQFTDINQCPTLTSLTPPSGSTLGGTRITVSGNYFPGTNTEKCRFRDSVKVAYVPYSNYTYSGSVITGVQCNTPAYIFNSPNVTVDVVFTSSNITVNTNNVTMPYTYYNCSASASCSSCYLIGSECGWCMATATCTNRASCPISINSSSVVEFAQNVTQCPFIADINPANGVVEGNTTIQISGGQFIPTLSYSCLFGNNTYANATYVNLTTIQCVTPANPTGSQGSIQNVSIVYRNQTNKVYARGGFFIYYNCQTSNSCLICLTGVCQWCLETATCGAVGSTCINAAQTCPVVTGIAPDQTFMSNPVEVFVAATYFPPNTTEKFQCRFQNTSLGITIPVNATYYNTTTVSCVSPTNFSSQVVQVSMYYKSRVYSPGSQDFEYYSCNANSCGSCVRSDRPQCGWCAIDNQCKIIGSSNCSTSTAPQTSCPTISTVDPDFGLTTSSSNNSVTVTFNQALPNGYSFYCSFGGIRTNATLTGSNTLNCSVPGSGSVGTVQLGVDIDSNPYSANTVDFEYLTCESLNDDCGRCHMVECDWCIPNFCQSPGSSNPCYATLDTCPTLTQLSPNHSELSGASVNVTGSEFSSGFVFSVNVASGGVNVSGPCGFVNETVLNCAFPPFNFTANTSALVLANGFPYLSTSLAYYYHDCQSQSSCGECVSVSSFCGWCIETSSCSQSSLCSGTFAQTCPVVTLQNNYAGLEGGSPIKVLGLFPSSVALECAWEGVATVPATFVNNTLVTCASPAVAAASTVNFMLMYANSSVPFYDNPISFDFIDCNYTVDTSSTEYPCSTCSNLVETRCVWCLRDNYCGPSYMCTGESMLNVNQCPFISGLDPLSGSKGGGDKVTITGANLVSDAELKCSFEDEETVKETSVTFVDSTTVTCKSPKWSGTGQVNMRLSKNEVAFSNSLSFTFNKESKQDTTGVIIGSVIGVIAFLALLGALVAFFALRRRGPASLKLVEPNYVAVAFAGNMPAYKLGKADMDRLESFRQILLHKDLSLAIAMLNATKITEADRVAKAMCYVFTSATQTVHLLAATIQDEVNIAERNTQGKETLFRSNSMATKIFTQYAKIVGLKYLWDTLARPVAELAALGKEKDTAPDRESSIMRLDSFEVDPTRMEDVDESDLAINQLQLILICQKVFTGIMKSVESIPSEIRDIMRYIKRQVEKVYPESTYIGMGGFFFLRFICPAMTAPHVYGLLPHPPNEETQRYLVLLSKALQNLANNTLPGVKETYMQKMNDFITSNQSKLINFFDQMVAGEASNNSNNNNNNTLVTGATFPVPKTQEDSALALLYTHTNKESKNVYSNLNDSNAKDVVSALTSLFAEGPPPEQIK